MISLIYGILKIQQVRAIGEGGDRMGWLNDNTNSMDVSSSKLWEIAKDRELWRAAVHRIAKSQT